MEHQDTEPHARTIHKGSHQPEELPSHWKLTFEYLYPILIEIHNDLLYFRDALSHNELSGILDAVKTGRD